MKIRRALAVLTLAATSPLTVPAVARAANAQPSVAPETVTNAAAVLPASASAYVPVTPCRLVDTRSGGGGRMAANGNETGR